LLVPLLFGCSTNQSKQTRLLVGEWKVISSTILPFEHDSFCKKLNLNTKFVFKANGGVEVYMSDSVLENCNGYQKFNADSAKIKFIEGDMAFFYELIKLTDDSLIFRNPNIPGYLFDNKFQSSRNDSIIRTIKREGIIVKLAKLNRTAAL
jgi:hypothetical protein